MSARSRSFGGVPRSIPYDNTKIAVARITGAADRERIGCDLHDLLGRRLGARLAREIEAAHAALSADRQRRCVPRGAFPIPLAQAGR